MIYQSCVVKYRETAAIIFKLIHVVKKMPSKLLSIFTLLYLLSGHAFSQITIGAPVWDGYSNTDETGVYLEILKEVYVEDELTFEFDSFHRLKHHFGQGKYDIILGVYDDDLTDALIPNWHLDLEYPITAFHLRSRNLKKAAHLKDLNVSWIRGYGFERFVAVPHKPYLVDSLRDGFKLLVNGRIDVLLDFPYNLSEEYANKVTGFELVPARKLFIAFQNTKSGINFARKFDAKMTLLRDHGFLKKLYKDEYQRIAFEALSQ